MANKPHEGGYKERYPWCVGMHQDEEVLQLWHSRPVRHI
jgi:hypothetical protein